MRVPAKAVLRAAVRWLELLPGHSPQQVRSMVRHFIQYADFTPTQYETAYEWLRATGLLETLHSHVPASRRVFDATLEHGSAPWFPDADQLVRTPDELPDDVRNSAEALGVGEGEAFGRLRTVWGKVDTEARARIGAAGEQALVDLLTDSVKAPVEHVAAWADGFGYDIAVGADPQPVAHLEVKATTRRTRFTFYLSRNEYETMRRDPYWSLVALRLNSDLEPVSAATVPSDWIAGQVPTDAGGWGRWESCRMDVPPEVLVSGVTAVEPLLENDTAGLLSGDIPWAQ